MNTLPSLLQRFYHSSHCIARAARFTTRTTPSSIHPTKPALRRAFATTMTGSQQLTLQRIAFTEAIQKHDPASTAVIHSLSGRSFNYGSLLADVVSRKEQLLKETGKDAEAIAGERIAFLVENSYDYAGV